MTFSGPVLRYLLLRRARNDSLEPTWPARILGIHAILPLGWPGAFPKGCRAKLEAVRCPCSSP
jgi:hypothetical protein